MTLWKDEFSGPAGQMIYTRPDRGDWSDGPGFRYFMEDLVWARDNCEGVVRVIAANPKDERGQTRRIADAILRNGSSCGLFTLIQRLAVFGWTRSESEMVGASKQRHTSLLRLEPQTRLSNRIRFPSRCGRVAVSKLIKPRSIIGEATNTFSRTKKAIVEDLILIFGAHLALN